MTTIVFRNGILAADTRAYSGDRSPIGEKQKIHQVRNSDKSISTFGISTASPGFSEEIVAWFANDKSHDYRPELNGREFQALEIIGGEVYYYMSNFTPSGPLTAEYFAIGSGSDFAIGALEMGATAQEAVQVSGKMDAWTGGVVQHIIVDDVVKTDDKPKKTKGKGK